MRKSIENLSMRKSIEINLSNIYRKSIDANIYRKSIDVTSIENLSKIYRCVTAIDNQTKIYRMSVRREPNENRSNVRPTIIPRTSIENLSMRNLSKIYWCENLSNIYRKSIDVKLYRTSIEHLSKIYRCGHLSKIYR